MGVHLCFLFLYSSISSSELPRRLSPAPRLHLRKEPSVAVLRTDVSEVYNLTEALPRILKHYRDTKRAVNTIGRFLRSETGTKWLAGLSQTRSGPLTTAELMDRLIEAAKPDGKVSTAAKLLRSALQIQKVRKGDGSSESSAGEPDEWDDLVTNIEQQDDIICLYRKDTEASMRKADDWKKFLKSVSSGYTVHLALDKGQKYVICLKKISVPDFESKESVSTTVLSIPTTDIEEATTEETSEMSDISETTTSRQEEGQPKPDESRKFMVTPDNTDSEESDCSKEEDLEDPNVDDREEEDRKELKPESNGSDSKTPECNRPIFLVMPNSGLQGMLNSRAGLFGQGNYPSVYYVPKYRGQNPYSLSLQQLLDGAVKPSWSPQVTQPAKTPTMNSGVMKSTMPFAENPKVTQWIMPPSGTLGGMHHKTSSVINPYHRQQVVKPEKYNWHKGHNKLEKYVPKLYKHSSRHRSSSHFGHTSNPHRKHNLRHPASVTPRSKLRSSHLHPGFLKNWKSVLGSQNSQVPVSLQPNKEMGIPSRDEIFSNQGVRTPDWVSNSPQALSRAMPPFFCPIGRNHPFLNDAIINNFITKSPSLLPVLKIMCLFRPQNNPQFLSPILVLTKFQESSNIANQRIPEMPPLQQLLILKSIMQRFPQLENQVNILANQFGKQPQQISRNQLTLPRYGVGKPYQKEKGKWKTLGNQLGSLSKPVVPLLYPAYSNNQQSFFNPVQWSRSISPVGSPGCPSLCDKPIELRINIEGPIDKPVKVGVLSDPRVQVQIVNSEFPNDVGTSARRMIATEEEKEESEFGNAEDAVSSTEDFTNEIIFKEKDDKKEKGGKKEKDDKEKDDKVKDDKKSKDDKKFKDLDNVSLKPELEEIPDENKDKDTQNSREKEGEGVEVESRILAENKIENPTNKSLDNTTAMSTSVPFG